ncbi:MAG: type II toxin-antitoxin system RelE/ParE family toxin [Coriobacteriia bacterium]|nr:type II toxin-antitoxin system RelE/ParE family toxin [Coriobacteriia bacterium]
MNVEPASKRAQIRSSVELLAAFPEMGSPIVTSSIVRRYGQGVRKLVASPFVVIYRYVEDLDEVRVLGLDHQRTIL